MWNSYVLYIMFHYVAILYWARHNLNNISYLVSNAYINLDLDLNLSFCNTNTPPLPTHLCILH